ncbi:MAG: DNA gyrase inhibitor YacG [Nitrospirota bacterium]
MSDAALCPICRTRKADPAHLPFCGPRCREVDMGRWLSGAYRVPTNEPAQPETSDPPTPSVNGEPNE